MMNMAAANQALQAVQNMHTSAEFEPAQPNDVDDCIAIRAQTRQNPISAAHLAELGITSESWSELVRTDALPGFVCRNSGRIIGYCFGERKTGEVVVLALLPEFENQGIGRKLLDLVVAELVRSGNTKLFLGCSADPGSRSYGFYRHLGWRSTNQFDSNGDEILEYHCLASGEA